MRFADRCGDWTGSYESTEKQPRCGPFTAPWLLHVRFRARPFSRRCYIYRLPVYRYLCSVDTHHIRSSLPLRRPNSSPSRAVAFRSSRPGLSATLRSAARCACTTQPTTPAPRSFYIWSSVAPSTRNVYRTCDRSYTARQCAIFAPWRG